MEVDLEVDLELDLEVDLEVDLEGGSKGKGNCCQAQVRSSQLNCRMRDNGCGLHDDGKF